MGCTDVKSREQTDKFPWTQKSFQEQSLMIGEERSMIINRILGIKCTNGDNSKDIIVAVVVAIFRYL